MSKNLQKSLRPPKVWAGQLVLSGQRRNLSSLISGCPQEGHL